MVFDQRLICCFYEAAGDAVFWGVVGVVTKVAGLEEFVHHGAKGDVVALLL